MTKITGYFLDLSLTTINAVAQENCKESASVEGLQMQIFEDFSLGHRVSERAYRVQDIRPWHKPRSNPNEEAYQVVTQILFRCFRMANHPCLVAPSLRSQ